jgi:hypothetical protein
MGRTYYTDGTGNGDTEIKIDCAWCIYCVETNKKILKTTEQKFSSLYMETLAMMECLKICKTDSLIFTDCFFLKDMLDKKLDAVDDQIESMIDYCRKLIREKRITIEWVSRYDNLAGKILSRRRRNLFCYRNACVGTHFSNKKLNHMKW